MNYLQGLGAGFKLKHLVSIAAVSVVLILGFTVFLDTNETENDVVLITISEVRADHVGPCYGYERDTMPGLCEIAEDGVMYKEAHNQGWFTLPTMSSLFTSQNHDQLNVINRNLSGVEPLDDKRLTMAEILREEGYSTSATVYPIRYVEKKYNFDQGFDEYNVTIDKSSYTDIDLDSEEPSFRWLHMGWPHCSNLRPPTEYDKWSNSSKSVEPYDCSSTNLTDSRLETTVNKYDGELRHTDAQISDLVENLKEKGRYKDTLIVVIGDHGTRLGENNYTGHGIGETDELPLIPRATHTNVPLIIKPPEGSKELDERKMVSNLDVRPTVMDFLGIKSEGRGVSLLNHDSGRRTVYYPIFSAIRTENYFYKEDPLVFINRSKSPAELENHSMTSELKNSLSSRLESFQDLERKTSSSEKYAPASPYSY
jgi:arylsulfatase A-like enzyme